jgi:hypothetical protein
MRAKSSWRLERQSEPLLLLGSYSAIVMPVSLSCFLSAWWHSRSGDNSHLHSCEAFSAVSSRSVVCGEADNQPLEATSVSRRLSARRQLRSHT